MNKQRQIVMKQAFVDYLPKLVGKELHQVLEKITLLTSDPLPDGKLKKQLKYMAGRPYRIRSGRYRIFYNFNDDVISLYKIDERDDDTYNDSGAPEAPPTADVLIGLDLPQDDVVATAPARPDWERIFNAPPTTKPLSEPITVKMLKRLRIPENYYARLLRIEDDNALLNCPGVPNDILLKVVDYLCDPPMEEVLQQPEHILNKPDDLLRRDENGNLIDFLLKLSPEQERYANWSLNSTGPTLIKGGPGTGKSTVALYRIRSLLQHLLSNGQESPKILFTTYTNALISSSKQLLEQLLGQQSQYVEVETADRIARKILTSCGQEHIYKPEADNDRNRHFIIQAINETTFAGNPLQQRAQRQTIERMGHDYLRQEFESVIVARQLNSLDDYLKTSRAGRQLRLNATQRGAVWNVYQSWLRILHEQGLETFSLRRVRAAEQVKRSPLFSQYDAVVIDEAQDLDPSALRTLIALCKAPNRLFITADANQSIYGSGFSWSDVHASLRFQGRTSILRANYRSTAEIGRAAQSYLASGQLEPEIIEPQYLNNGPMPDARSVRGPHDEAQLLAAFFRKASSNLRQTISSCAILCPNEPVGRSLAIALGKQGLEATYMSGRNLSLTNPGIKIITLKSSKGLEFPIVALAGFSPTNFPVIPPGAAREERAELLDRERRTMFVGMTRAMRALLVIIPQDARTPLLQGFDARYWNFTRDI
jgi:Superfamily I DNA and RNA helicases